MNDITHAIDWLKKYTTTLDGASHKIKMEHIATLRVALTPKSKPSRGEHWTKMAFETAQIHINAGMTYDQVVACLNEEFEGNFTRSQLSHWLYKGDLKPKFRKVYRKVGA